MSASFFNVTMTGLASAAGLGMPSSVFGSKSSSSFWTIFRTSLSARNLPSPWRLGKFLTAGPEEARRLERDHQIALRYVDADGHSDSHRHIYARADGYAHTHAG